MEHIAKIQRSPDVIAAKVGEEYVLLSPVTGEYFALNVVAGRAWELLGQPTDTESLLTTLIGEFRVEASVLKADLAQLLESLSEKMLIQKL